MEICVRLVDGEDIKEVEQKRGEGEMHGMKEKGVEETEKIMNI